jgi:hypothetical protein
MGLVRVEMVCAYNASKPEPDGGGGEDGDGERQSGAMEY